MTLRERAKQFHGLSAFIPNGFLTLILRTDYRGSGYEIRHGLFGSAILECYIPFLFERICHRRLTHNRVRHFRFNLIRSRSVALEVKP